MKVIDIAIECQDSYPLVATLYSPKETKAAIMISPATGIKRQFYANFARHLCEQGYGVITFDNRGIGDSQTTHVSKSNASLQLWGEQDMPAVLESLKEKFPDKTYHLVGHSAGGQLIGLMPNAKQISSVFNFACSSGQIKNMKQPYRLKAKFFMNVFSPLCNLLFGYTKSDLVGMGEPLPKKVAQQWRFWCNGAGYVKTAFGVTVDKHLYDEIDMPSFWTNATDDDIAIDANVDDMLSVFTKARVTAKKMTFVPQEHNLSDIGHMKFFSRNSSHLWQYATNWLEENTN